MKIDLRTKEGKAHKAALIVRATELREVGWRASEIARSLGVSESWVMTYLPHRLAILDPYELADRRKAAVFDLDVRDVTTTRRSARDLKEAAEVLERDAMARLTEEWHAALAAARASRRLERAEQRTEQRAVQRAERELLRAEKEFQRAQQRAAREAERERRRVERELERERIRRRREAHKTRLDAERERSRRTREIRRSIASPLRLDAPLPNGDGAFGDLIAAKVGDADPQTYVERRLLDHLVGNLSINEIDRLDDRSLARLQDKLREAGFVPRGVQRKERERLREPGRHRGSAPPMTFQPVHSKRRSRKDQQQLMAGKRTSRKQPKRWDRERVEYDWRDAA